MADSGEWRKIVNYLKSTGVPFRVTSTYRPTDYDSRHGKGLAADFGGPRPWSGKKPDPDLLKIFNAFTPIENRLHELIYSGASYNVKNGRRVPRYAISGHWDHCHVAIDYGTVLPSPSQPPAQSEGSLLLWL